MDINVNRTDVVLTISPVGRLDSVSSGELSACIDANFTADVPGIVIDMTGVDYISSSGLRVLVALYKSLAGRRMEVTSANASVREVFRLSGLAAVFGME